MDSDPILWRVKRIAHVLFFDQVIIAWKRNEFPRGIPFLVFHDPVGIFGQSPRVSDIASSEIRLDLKNDIGATG